MKLDMTRYHRVLHEADTLDRKGRVVKIVGLTVEATGPSSRIGDICHIYALKGDSHIRAEVVGFREDRVLLMPYGPLEGVGLGSLVQSSGESLQIGVGLGFMGRVLDALGNPMDGLEAPEAEAFYPVDADPPNPLARERIREIMPLGIKAMDGLLTVGRGQRLGIFAGSGVGKSTTLGMIARNAEADVNVIALVGERGREVRDFIERDLGEEGLKRSVLLVATSDQPALLRLKVALVATSFAEFFRDKGYKVLMLMDSLTRFAMAQREIGMATGEPPVSRGYPPSVYTVLPRLLERSGTSDKGSITGLYTVLVEGDDMNEPISDTVRGILDGHIVLSRRIANSNHYPPIDVLASVSRVMTEIAEPEHLDAAGNIKNIMAVYQEAQDLINIGAYQKGANPEIDRAILLYPRIQQFLRQSTTEFLTFEDTVQTMSKIIVG